MRPKAAGAVPARKGKIISTQSYASSTRVDEIADGIFRISTPVPASVVPGGFTFNQFLIRDADPLLFHTGPRMMFGAVREAIERVIPVASLRYISFSHVEADACGSLNQFLAVAPQAVPLLRPGRGNGVNCGPGGSPASGASRSGAPHARAAYGAVG